MIKLDKSIKKLQPYVLQNLIEDLVAIYKYGMTMEELLAEGLEDEKGEIAFDISELLGIPGESN